MISQREEQDEAIGAVFVCVSAVPCLCCSVCPDVCMCTVNYGRRCLLGTPAQLHYPWDLGHGAVAASPWLGYWSSNS